MKKESLFKSLIALSMLCFVLAACGDDEDKKANEWLVAGVPVEVGDVYLTQGIEGNNEGYSLIVTSTGISVFQTDDDTDDFKGDGHIFFLFLKNDITTPLKEGTYTFNSDGELPQSLFWGQLNTMVDDRYINAGLVKAGTVDVSKSGTTYTITYDLTLELDETEIAVTGYYSGNLKPAYFLF